jgi:hypothetical protein
MQLKFNQDGLLDESLVDDVRIGMAAAGEKLGPVNLRSLKRNRPQFLNLADGFARQSDETNAYLFGAALLDSTFLVTNKPAIAWNVDDVLMGITFTVSTYQEFKNLTADRIATFASELLTYVGQTGVARTDLGATIGEEWVTKELQEFLDAQVGAQTERADAADVLALSLANLRNSASFQSLANDVQKELLDSTLPLFADMMQEIAYEALGNWHAAGIKRILFNYFVPNVVLSEALAEALPNALVGLVETNPDISPEPETVIESIQKAAWSFTHEATYPGYYTADKRVAMVAVAAGVDLSDGDALDSFADNYWDSKAGQEEYKGVGRGFGGLWDYLDNERFFHQLKLKDQESRLFYQYMEPFYIVNLDPDWQAKYNFGNWQQVLSHRRDLALLDVVFGRTKTAMITHISEAFAHQSKDEVARHVTTWIDQVNGTLGQPMLVDKQGQLAFADREALLRALPIDESAGDGKRLPALMAVVPAEVREQSHTQITQFIEKLAIQLGDFLEMDQVRWAEEMLGNLAETAGGQWQQRLTELGTANFSRLLESEIFGAYSMRQSYFALQILIAFLDNSRVVGDLEKSDFDDYLVVIADLQTRRVGGYLLDVMKVRDAQMPL